MEEQAKQLQDRLAEVDVLTRPSRSSEMMELLIKRLLRLGIRMEADQHERAHVHIDYGKERHHASYAVDDGSRLAGSLHRKYDRVVKIWIEDNREELQALWEAMKTGCSHSVVLAKLKAD
ncbi:DUF4160 domain-containing protein [Pseudomonas sp. CFBP 13602]|uniref:DUF4160 domain-containing protein n=1 Tax=Pseudomonas sp. CFBP 13602 TaxID=2774039 RepID=UPI00177D6561|nr:DUF4160 domain-containing protein [Pseudomonas sp. CFBP 13602]MBD8825354.1 DUF4160 domain-containing protein [Pseudomonas sp. CFBP 13602]